MLNQTNFFNNFRNPMWIAVIAGRNQSVKEVMLSLKRIKTNYAVVLTEDRAEGVIKAEDLLDNDDEMSISECGNIINKNFVVVEADSKGQICRETDDLQSYDYVLLRKDSCVVGVVDMDFNTYTSKDMTYYQEREKELSVVKEKERDLNSIIQSSYDGIYITDKNGLTLMVNKAHERISGVRAEEIVGRYMKDIVAEGFFSQSITDMVVEAGAPITIKQMVSNGKELIITGSPIFGEDGQVEKVITNVRDVTELISLEKKLKMSREITALYRRELFNEDENYIVCDSKSFTEVLSLARKAAKTDSTVLILGETGVGKEVIAKTVHTTGARKSNEYLKINCGAIPGNLLESELFGYVRGAFTGANQNGKMGMFELANKGTLFLDEIGELPLNLQSSLLRVLQDGEIIRIGDSKSRKVDVRIIAATNRNLEEMIKKDIFRADLFYRLNVVSLRVPPLRERIEDIPGLAELTVDKLNRKYRQQKIITSSFIEYLCGREWTGNVRELENFIERQFVISDEDILDIQKELKQESKNPRREAFSVDVLGLPYMKEAVAELEGKLLRSAMEKGKNTYKAAELLGMSQPTFFRKYKELCGVQECEEGQESQG